MKSLKSLKVTLEHEVGNLIESLKQEQKDFDVIFAEAQELRDTCVAIMETCRVYTQRLEEAQEPGTGS